MEEQELCTIWMRLGIDLIGTEEEIDKVLGGDEETLIRLLKAKSFTISDDTYIPREDGEEISFDLPTIEFD